MAKYSYPAIFTKEKSGYSVLFPDLEGCYTCGEDLTESIEMAEDVLAFTLYHYETTKKEIPAPTPIEKISLEKNEFISFVACDTLEYHKMHSDKIIKKTLSIPEWLNESAVSAGINFSQTLKEALIQKLGVGV